MLIMAGSVAACSLSACPVRIVGVTYSGLRSDSAPECLISFIVILIEFYPVLFKGTTMEQINDFIGVRSQHAGLLIKLPINICILKFWGRFGLSQITDNTR